MEIRKLFRIKYFVQELAIDTIGDFEHEIIGKANIRWFYKGTEYRIILQKGFRWYGLVMPRFFWKMLGFLPTSSVLQPFLWHAYMYSKKGKITNYIPIAEEHLDRKHVDRLFYCLMIKTGISENLAKKIYWGARIFGYFSWGKIKTPSKTEGVSSEK
jgi:hypothetical protein